MDFNKAIDAHVAWKTKLAAYLRKPDGSISASSLEPDNLCELGKWLHGEGRALTSLPDYPGLVESHAQFHKAAAAVVRRAEQGQNVTEELLLGSNSEFAKASNAVVMQLVKCKRAA